MTQTTFAAPTTETNSEYAERFFATFPAPGQSLKVLNDDGSFGQGRPSTIGPAEAQNNYQNKLTVRTARVAQERPWLAAALLESLAYKLSEEERTEVRESKDAFFQSVDDETGHVLQVLANARLDCGTLEQTKAIFVAAALPLAVNLATLFGTPQYVALVRRAITRQHRTGNGSTLNGRTSLGQHAMYISNEAPVQGKGQKHFLVLAVAFPNGTSTTFGPQDLEATITVPAPLAVTTEPEPQALTASFTEAPAEAQGEPEAPEAIQAPEAIPALAEGQESAKERKNRKAREARAAAKAAANASA